MSLPVVTPDVHDTETVYRSCGLIDDHQVEPVERGPRKLEMRCGHCSKHIQWVSPLSAQERAQQRREGIRAWMSTQKPTVAQLRTLRNMGYKGKKPTSKLEAHDAIEALKKARGSA